MPMNEITPNRFGQFLLIAGLLLLVTFFATDQLGSPQFCLFIWGVSAVGMGGFLIWRNHRPRPRESDRFRTVRRAAKRFNDWRAYRRSIAAQKKKK